MAVQPIQTTLLFKIPFLSLGGSPTGTAAHIISAKRIICEQISAPCQSIILKGIVFKVKNQAFPSPILTIFLLIFNKNNILNMCKNPINKIEYRYHFNKKSASECQFSPHGSAGDPCFFQSAPSSRLSPPKSSFQDRSKSKKSPPVCWLQRGFRVLFQITSGRCRSEDPAPHRSAGSGRSGRYRPHQTCG